MKTFAVENKIIDFILKHIDLLFVIIITAVGLYVRYCMRHYVSGDYYSCVGVWIDYIKSHGGIYALKDTFANYNQPYLFLLTIIAYINWDPMFLTKILSVIFDFILAIFSSKIVKELTKDDKLTKMYSIMTYSIVFLLPTVMMNSALWAQCDSIYSAFVVVSLYYLIKKDYLFSFIFLGFGFAFKLQAIFVLPLFLIHYFKEKEFSFLNFLIIPVTNLILCLPSIIVGHPISHCFEVFFGQVDEYKRLSLNMFNIWGIFNMDYAYDYLSSVGVGVVLLIFGLLLYYLILKKINLNEKDYINLALLSVMVCVFFLPAMHDRYLYLADALSIIFCFINKDIIVGLVVQLISFVCYIPFLFGEESIFKLVSIAFGLILYKVFKMTFDFNSKSLKEK